jgi:hypothetical protein
MPMKLEPITTARFGDRSSLRRCAPPVGVPPFCHSVAAAIIERLSASERR